jgi:hypothetical protein
MKRRFVLPQYALSEEEGRAAYEEMRPAIEAFGPGNVPLVLDMTHCAVLCSHWLSGFFSPLFAVYPAGEVEYAIRIEGASATNQQAVTLMYAVAHRHAEELTEQYTKEQEG